MRMTAVLLIALGAVGLLRHRSAALRHWVLAAAIAGAAMMPLLQMVVPVWSLPLADSSGVLKVGSTVEPAVTPTAEAHVTTQIHISGAPQIPSRRSFAATVADSLPRIWIAGIVISVGILMIGLARLTWLAANSRRIRNGPWMDLADEIAREYGIERRFLLLQSDHPTLLVTWGLALPKIILPAAASSWSDDRARIVLSHELAHIRRGDWLVQMAAELLRGVYWFNPLLWVFCRRLRLESEHACDDEVINHGVGGSDYASHLVDLARALHQRHAWLPAPAMARPSSLERRVRAMLNDRLNRGAVSGSTRALIFALVFCVAAAVAAAQNAFQTFSGTVVDATGLPVPGVTLALSNPQRQAKYEVKSNDLGGFEFIGLPSGEYTLEVKANGFATLKDSFALKGANLQRRLALRIGSLEETIFVASNASDDKDAPARARVTEARPPAKANPVACVPTSTGGRIVPPRKIRDVSPIYPPNLRGTGTEGQVVMLAKLGVDGDVIDIRTVGTPQPDLAAAAIEAVRQWRFTQTLLNCTPVEPEMTITTTFKPIPAPPPAPPPPPRP